MKKIFRHIKKKHILLVLLAAVVIGGAVAAWNRWAAPTRIAFVNYQAVELGKLSRAGRDLTFVRLDEVGPDDFKRLTDYDMIFVNGMGLRLDSAQRAALQAAAERRPTLTHAATNPENNITSLTGFDAEYLLRYLQQGGRANYRSLLQYVRRFVDGKRLWAPEPARVEEHPDYLLTHYDPKDAEADELGFQSVADYEAFLRKNNLMRKGAPAVVLTGFMGASADLTRAFEERGVTVYRVGRWKQFLQGGHADSVRVRAVVNMAHGRMGDDAVAYLTKRNIPLFTTISVGRLTDEWLEDKRGLSGGFLSQSIVTPELDGAVRPYAVFAQRVTDEGLQEVYGIPERMADFVESVKATVRLQTKRNADKRVAIVYFKGPGQNALVASGMDVAASLFNLLKRLQTEGYNVKGLPASAEGLAQLIQQQGAVFGPYAEGAHARFLAEGRPAFVTQQNFDEWSGKALSPAQRQELRAQNGAFPGPYLADQQGRLAVARVELGNVVLIPQTMAGTGTDEFRAVHGTDQAPPYAYVAPYLWARYAFRADALIHFGTHGSLEYTPRKQVALSMDDWSDRLVGTLPHLYVYTTGNVGEAMIAKRRTYAATVSHLTPPFRESALRSTYKALTDAVAAYDRAPSAALSLRVKALAVEMGVAADLGLDTKDLKKPYTADEVARVENFAEELVSEKMTGRLYTLGIPYAEADIRTTVRAMATDPIAYGLLAVDRQKHRAAEGVERHRQRFDQLYGRKARAEVERLLAGATVDDAYILRLAGITADELATARRIEAQQNAPDPIMMMMQMADGVGASPSERKKGKPDTRTVAQLRAAGEMGRREIPQLSREAFEKMEQTGRFPKKMMDALRKGQRWYQLEQKQRAALAKAGKKQAAARDTVPVYTQQQKALAQAITAIETALRNVRAYADALRESPEHELSSILNGLAGGYVVPSSGGDPVVNPRVLPTGRNLYAINAENTPTEAAWEQGKTLADETLRMYRQRHGGQWPRKVSYTLWSSEFVETGGATIAQVLYMLGVEPVRDAFGRVTDLRLIPSRQLGRPRIDVVVQTSGQLRDLAASRLYLIQRAVAMAAEAGDTDFDNLVSEGVRESERALVEKGMSPKEAREVSRFRVFGGLNGGYGTGIQAMVEAGDRWEKESQIADVYLHNMNAYYGDEQQWEAVRDAALEAALTRTDVVVQPRQSNTWGALSLDHVYEFMGGMNLAVRHVTGTDPDAYLADYRNHQNMRMQEVKEAIGVESRTTLLNPAYIRAQMESGASGADAIASMVKNTYGWNVMKPKAIDQALWNKIFDTYVTDREGLGTKAFFQEKNPAALEELTAVMLESARKGLWKASQQQVDAVARLHVETVNRYKPSCSGFVCDNGKLRAFIAAKTDAATARQYEQNVSAVRNARTADDGQGKVLKKETVAEPSARTRTVVSGLVVGVLALAALVGLALVVRRRRRMER